MADTSEQTNWLVCVGALRDGLLVMASITYGLGYLVWSVHALEQGLGLLPALDAQYFVAGAFPVLVLVAAFYGFRLITRTVEQLLEWLYSEPKTRTKTLAHGLAYSLIVLPGIILLLSGISGYVQRAIAWKWGVAVLYGAIFLGSMLYYTHGTRDFNSKGARFYRLFQIGNVIFLGGLIVVGYFLGSIYPHLPQELGGVQPRCAYLDLTKSELSTPTLSALVDAEALQHSTPVVRSKRLEIPYSSSNVIIVRYDGRVYDLYRQAIKAITSCEERTVKEQPVASQELPHK